MQIIKKTGEGFLIGGISFLLFLLFFEDRIHLPAWVQVIGRMHPMFLHFPIVLLLVYFISLWSPAKESTSWTDGIRLLAVLTAVITAIMGLLLSLEEERSGQTFSWHKWGGIFIALISFLLYYLHAYLRGKSWLVRPLTVSVSLLLLLTGHWGADLTHGENYLLEPIAGSEIEKAPLDKAMAFQHVIKPILEQKCTGCHGAANTKGGLILEDTSSVLRGGKTGPLLIAGRPDSSLLIKRILLPPEDKKHMAPGTKPQLSEAEVQLLQAWIKSGAPLSQKIISLPVQDSFRILAAGYLAPSTTGDQIAYGFPPAPESKIRALNNNFRVVTPLGMGAPALAVQFYGAGSYSAKALEELLQVKEQITELSLARLPVKDEDLRAVQQFKNLQKLNLNYTHITGKGLLQLATLKKLQELSLAGVRLSAAEAMQLSKLPALAALYVWNANLDSAAVAALQNSNKGLIIETGYIDDGQTILPLNPPVAKTVPGIYEPASLIELKHPFRGVEIRYTLDESEPDSVRSPLYKEPLKLDKFTVVKARAFRPGWYGSKAMKAVYFTKGIKPDSVVAISKSQTYKGKEQMLFDAEIGDLNLSSGKWLEVKEPVTYLFYFKEPVTVRQVSMNTFVRMDWDIFPASKIEVWAGMHQGNLKRISTWKQAPPSKMEDPDLQQPKMDFAATQVRCMRVVVHPLSSIPAWRPSKGKPSKVFLSEVVLN